MEAFLIKGSDYLGAVLDGTFYGFHTAVFFLFIAVHKYQRKKFYRGPLEWAVIALWILCTGVVMVDIWSIYYEETDQEEPRIRALNSAYSTLYSIIDFISQMVLIYRCWIIWNKNQLVLLPSLLSLSAMVCDFILVALFRKPADLIPENVVLNLGRYSFSASLAVNLIVMLMIIMRIWTISRQVSHVSWSSKNSYEVVIAMILESGVPILLGQLVWLVLFATNNAGFDVVAGAITQLYGITPAILLIRVTMGTAYDSTSKTRVKNATSTSLEFHRQGRSYETHSIPLETSPSMGSRTLQGNNASDKDLRF